MDDHDDAGIAFLLPGPEAEHAVSSVHLACGQSGKKGRGTTALWGGVEKNLTIVVVVVVVVGQ